MHTDVFNSENPSSLDHFPCQPARCMPTGCGEGILSGSADVRYRGRTYTSNSQAIVFEMLRRNYELTVQARAARRSIELFTIFQAAAGSAGRLGAFEINLRLHGPISKSSKTSGTRPRSVPIVKIAVPLSRDPTAAFVFLFPLRSWIRFVKCNTRPAAAKIAAFVPVRARVQARVSLSLFVRSRACLETGN